MARADANAASFYGLVIEHGSSPERLGSAPDDVVFFSLCRVDGSGRHDLARRRYDRPVKPTEFLRAQLVVEKGNLLAAIRAGDERPMYVGCHDPAIARGRCGVFADLSKASFRQFRATSDLRRIRDAWELEEV
jgi:hypothetical protein